MKRSDFLKNSFVVSSGLILAPTQLLSSSSARKKEDVQITILHTNDTHSNIDAFPTNHAKYPGLGGVEKRYDMIQSIRREEKNVLLLDAGDIFQGTPYFNKYKGVLEMKIMSKLGYEAATMGNHDFDGGMDGFLNAKQFADFPFLCSNYDFNETILKNETKSQTIITKGGVKIGIFGVGVQLQGLVPDSKFEKTVYYDPIKIANEQAASLKKQGCDLIICLSHLGYSYTSDKVSDLKLAGASNNIHLIIGGHTHTFLDVPTEVKNASGELVLVNQVGWAGVNLGRIDFTLEGKFKHHSESLKVG